MSHPPRGLRPASPSVTRLGTTTALPWRTGRSLKSSSTPRPFSTKVAPRPSTGFPPHHVPCHHGRGCLVSTGTSVTACPRHWGGGQDNPSVLGAEWAWPWMDSCWGQGRWVGSRGFPLWFLQLRAAGQLHAQGTTTIRPFSLTAHCNAFKPTLSWSLSSSRWFGFHVPSVLRCSLGTPGPDLCALRPPEALASWTWASAGHSSVLSSLGWGCWAFLDALPRVGDTRATVPAPPNSDVQTITVQPLWTSSSLVWPRGLELAG